MRCFFVFIVLIVAVSAVSCGSRKLILRNCEKAGTADYWVCDKV